ncbi:PAS domain-containing protein [Mucilaginibacter robiniae]|uniref:PAS domain-containing protein n=1 Tax=Mucilaginibacter robiniae TaxID=2728022 RepID=A0A7L5E0G6_9SPHI|nr:PAS domain-containing protein [Mucilaginibacter robiniae]QJD95988.1 PAS domain-containing protein [Mucilaginibacter robiniae]
MQNISEQRLVDALPIGAAVFTGDRHTIRAVNAEMRSIWSKDSSVIGKDLHDAIPEIQDQPFFDLLTNIYRTGEAFHDPNGQAMLNVNGVLQLVYFDYWMKPIRDAAGQVTGILNTAIDTTAAVIARQRSEWIGEQFSFSMNAAEVGSWNLDIANRRVWWDERCRLFYGFPKGDDLVPFEEVLRYVHPEDRPKVDEAVAHALRPESGGNYDIQFRTIGESHHTLRWLQCKGKAYLMSNTSRTAFPAPLVTLPAK